MWIGFILSQKIWKFVTSLSLRLIWKKELMSIPNKLRETFHRWLIFFAFPRPCSRLFWCSFCFRFRFRLWSRFHLGLSRFWQSCARFPMTHNTQKNCDQQRIKLEPQWSCKSDHFQRSAHRKMHHKAQPQNNNTSRVTDTSDVPTCCIFPLPCVYREGNPTYQCTNAGQAALETAACNKTI